MQALPEGAAAWANYFVKTRSLFSLAIDLALCDVLAGTSPSRFVAVLLPLGKVKSRSQT